MRTVARAIVVLLLFAGVCRAFAQSADEVLTKQSFLAVSAFQCAVVASDSKQRERLFMLGLKNGREFIESANSKPDLYAKIRSQVPMLWNMTSGPTTDFVLGQVYAQLEADIYKKFDSDDKLWRLIKDNMFREKNCALLQ